MSATERYTGRDEAATVEPGNNAIVIAERINGRLETLRARLEHLAFRIHGPAPSRESELVKTADAASLLPSLRDAERKANQMADLLDKIEGAL